MTVTVKELGTDSSSPKNRSAVIQMGDDKSIAVFCVEDGFNEAEEVIAAPSLLVQPSPLVGPMKQIGEDASTPKNYVYLYTPMDDPSMVDIMTMNDVQDGLAHPAQNFIDEQGNAISNQKPRGGIAG